MTTAPFYILLRRIPWTIRTVHVTIYSIFGEKGEKVLVGEMDHGMSRFMPMRGVDYDCEETSFVGQWQLLTNGSFKCPSLVDEDGEKHLTEARQPFERLVDVCTGISACILLELGVDFYVHHLEAGHALGGRCDGREDGVRDSQFADRRL
jgi:hypothetical protein